MPLSVEETISISWERPARRSLTVRVASSSALTPNESSRQVRGGASSIFPGISTMTLADDCSFGIDDGSKWRFVGATGQTLFEMALSPFLLVVYLPTPLTVFGK